MSKRPLGPLIKKLFQKFNFVLLMNYVLFGDVQEYPIFDQNRDSFDTERTRNGLQKTRNKLPLQKIKHFVLLCN
jgi:hypothetical protein